MGERKGFYKVGDGVPGFTVLDQGRGNIVSEMHTVVEILPAPKNESELHTLGDHFESEYIIKGRSVAMVSGENLLDDPKHMGHIDPDKVYFLEK